MQGILCMAILTRVLCSRRGVVRRNGDADPEWKSCDTASHWGDLGQVSQSGQALPLQSSDNAYVVENLKSSTGYILASPWSPPNALSSFYKIFPEKEACIYCTKEHR